jgi:hypothetical protein
MGRNMTATSLAAICDTIVAMRVSRNREDGARGIAQRRAMNSDLKRVEFGGFTSNLQRESELTNLYDNRVFYLQNTPM